MVFRPVGFLHGWIAPGARTRNTGVPACHAATARPAAPRRTSSVSRQKNPKPSDGFPKEYLLPVPRLAKGHVVLGHDERGCCPMLVVGRCSIYEHRPHTCRIFDCRAFSAAGIEAGDHDRERVNQRIHRWRFSHPAARDCKEHCAVQAAAKFLREHTDRFPEGFVPSNPAQLATLSIKVFDVFIDFSGAGGGPSSAPADLNVVRAVIASMRLFEAYGPRKRDAREGFEPPRFVGRTWPALPCRLVLARSRHLLRSMGDEGAGPQARLGIEPAACRMGCSPAFVASSEKRRPNQGNRGPSTWVAK